MTSPGGPSGPGPGGGSGTGPGRLDASALAVLERLTDPTQHVLAECVDAVARLRKTVHGLKVVRDEDGDAREWLEYLVSEVDDLIDRLAEVIEEKK